MPILNTTPNQGYQLPFAGNNLVDDVARLIFAVGQIDTDIASALAVLSAKAGLASPAFTGTPNAPTAAPGTNTGQLATTAFVKAAFDALVGGAPGALDTLNELAAAIGDNADYAASIVTALAGKLDRDGSNFANEAEKATFRNNLGLLLHGQCRLELDAGVLKLKRFNGQFLVINGNLEVIPATPPQLASTGLTVGTSYYIYAYMSGATMTLEASTTTHTDDATTGVRIKTGDATRTLVGFARPTTGPAWVDTSNYRQVKSWFNRKPVNLTSGSISGSTTSGSWSPIGTTSDFLLWAGESVTAIASGSLYSSLAGNTSYVGLGVSGATPGTTPGDYNLTQTSYYDPFASVAAKYTAVDAFAYLRVYGLAVSGAHTMAIANAGINSTIWI